MLPYLHILIRVEEDGSLRALGAFTSKEKQQAYLEERRLTEKDVRRDFYNGPFNSEIKAIYAGHRKWNMERYQLGGYFQTEGDAWNSVTQEGYVGVLRIDTTYADQQTFEEQALQLYDKLQKRWRLTSYKELIKKEGSAKTNANITLRFYVDALESFKPKTKRDMRALYALLVFVPIFPIALFHSLGQRPKYGENLDSVKWLPEVASDVSYYQSAQINVYEFNVNETDFLKWAELNGMTARRLATQESISRYKAYMVADESKQQKSNPTDGEITVEEFTEWQSAINAKFSLGFIARNNQTGAKVIFDSETERAYYEEFK
ncbi:MAG: hypothetical protein AAGC73_01845 [Verrucomicrobiota bacterium]